MKYLKIYEAKKNWLEITQNKLKDFKNMIDSNPILKDWNINDVLSELTVNLKDIAGSKFNVYYEEHIKFICDSDYITTMLTKNGNIKSFGGQDSPYSTYRRITNWLDKKRLSGKEIKSVYLIYIEIESNSDDYFEKNNDFVNFTNSEKYKEWVAELNDIKSFLESVGFEVNVHGFDLNAKIQLQKTEEVNKKSLDLSDIVPPNIVDDFERFILKKNLTRSDAEELAKIFKKS